MDRSQVDRTSKSWPESKVQDSSGDKSELTVGLLLFVTLGILTTVYGPAIPSFRQIFNLDPVAAGFLPTSHFLGALCGLVGLTVMGNAWTSRRFLTIGSMSFTGGCASAAVAPYWWLVVLAAWLIGLGLAVLQVTVIATMAKKFGQDARVVLNLLHAFLGIGLVLGPALVALAPQAKPLTFLLGVALVAGFATSRLRRSLGEEGESVVRVGGRFSRFLMPAVVIYIFYVGIEIGIGSWKASHLVETGYSTRSAALFTMVYWAALSLGRAGAAVLPRRISDRAILTVCLLCAGTSLVAMLIVEDIPLMYAIAGFFLGPIFPTVLVWLNRLESLSIASTGLIMGGAMIGGIITPALLGWSIASFGFVAVPIMLAPACALCLAAVVWLHSWAPLDPRQR